MLDVLTMAAFTFQHLFSGTQFIVDLFKSHGNLLNIATAKNIRNSQQKLVFSAASWRGDATNCSLIYAGLTCPGTFCNTVLIWNWLYNHQASIVVTVLVLPISMELYCSNCCTGLRIMVRGSLPNSCSSFCLITMAAMYVMLCQIFDHAGESARAGSIHIHQSHKQVYTLHPVFAPKHMSHFQTSNTYETLSELYNLANVANNDTTASTVC